MTGLVWRWTFDGKGRHSAAVLGYACRGNKTSIVSSLPQEFYENAHVRAIAQKCSAPSRIFDGPGGVPGIRAEGCRYGSHAASRIQALPAVEGCVSYCDGVSVGVGSCGHTRVLSPSRRDGICLCCVQGTGGRGERQGDRSHQRARARTREGYIWRERLALAAYFQTDVGYAGQLLQQIRDAARDV